jgi:hypothetical protein
MLTQKSHKVLSNDFGQIISYIDISIVLGLVTLVSILVFNYFPEDLIHLQDVWFDADTYRVSEGLMDHMSGTHYRSAVHPLFPIFSSTLPILLNRIFSLDTATSLSIMTSVVASIWVTVLYGLLRLMGCLRLDATIFSLLGLSSSGAMFWLAVPESYSYGSITILLALCFTVLTETRSFSVLWYVAVSAMTFSITVTNWMFGIAATFLNHSRKKSFQITLVALGSVFILTIFQKIIFRYATILNFLHFRGETTYSAAPTATKFMMSSISFWLHTMVTPNINFGFYLDQAGFLSLSIQKSLPQVDNPLSLIALITWILLLVLGIWSMFTVKEHQKLRHMIGIGILGQFLLHLVYGTETFLYSLHFVPLLVTLVALSTLTTRRWLTLALAIVFVISAGISNSLHFQQAVILIQ